MESQHRAHLEPEQLHDSNSSIYADIDERFEALGRHQIHDQIIPLGLNEVEITRPGEVASQCVRYCRRLVGRHNVVTTHDRSPRALQTCHSTSKNDLAPAGNQSKAHAQ